MFRLIAVGSMCGLMAGVLLAQDTRPLTRIKER
jgi:hypothetical protein